MAEPIDISQWRRDPEHPTFPEGKREKSAMLCPDPPPCSCLIANHRYLFKLSLPRYPHEFLSEVVASRIGQTLGVATVRAWVGFDSARQTAGALIEWFFGKPGDPTQVKQSGGDFMTKMIRDYDRRHGTQHNFRTVRTLFESLEKVMVVGPDWPAQWADLFLFDALIGNTDRHQDNWGLIWSRVSRPRPAASGGVRFEFVTSMQEPAARLTPAYDNGSSLGREFSEDQIREFMDGRKSLEKYVGNGWHHMKWDLTENLRLNHAEFIRRYAREFPMVVTQLRQRLSFSESTLRAALHKLTQVRVGCPLSEMRLEFMLKLISLRQKMILDAL